MRANVVVRDPGRVDDAPHHEGGGADRVAGVTVPLEQLADRSLGRARDDAQQPFLHAPRRRAGRAHDGVIRLAGGGHRRIAPLDDAAGAGPPAILPGAGLGTLLTQLGGQVRNPAEARAVRDHYLDVLGQVRRRGLPAQLSVKLTHLGLDVDRAACAAALGALAARAEQSGSFLWIDMEESRYVDATLDLYREVRAEHARVGVCLQAYLHRTFTDLDRLVPLGPAIRVVKGAYNEPPAVAFPKKRDVDAAYVALAERLLKEAARARALPVFGTHDLRLIGRLRERARALGVPRDG